MLNRKTVMALAAAMVMAALYGCSGSDNSGLKNDLEMAEEQVADLTAERDRARITPEALEALKDALGTMDLTPANLMTLVMRADITQGAYDALMAVLPAGMELTLRTLSELAGRVDLTQAQFENLESRIAGRMMPLNVLNLRGLAGRADITAADYDALMDAMGDMDLDVRTLEDLVARAEITQATVQAALMVVLPNLNVGTTLQDVVTMAGQYTELLDALGATGMDHADAVALAMDLVAEDTADTIRLTPTGSRGRSPDW